MAAVCARGARDRNLSPAICHDCNAATSVREGEVVDSTRSKAEDEQDAEEGGPGIGNINILEL